MRRAGRRERDGAPAGARRGQAVRGRPGGRPGRRRKASDAVSAFRTRGGAARAPTVGRGIARGKTSCRLALGSRPGGGRLLLAERRPAAPRPPVPPLAGGDWAGRGARRPRCPGPGKLDAGPRAVPGARVAARGDEGETAGGDARRPRGDDGWKRVASEAGSRGRGEAAAGRAPASAAGERHPRPGSDPGRRVARAVLPPRGRRGRCARSRGSQAARNPACRGRRGPRATLVVRGARGSSCLAGTRRSGFEPKAVRVGAGLAQVPAGDSPAGPVSRARGTLWRSGRGRCLALGRWAGRRSRKGSCADPIDGH